MCTFQQSDDATINKASESFKAIPEISAETKKELQNEILFDANKLKPSKFKDILFYYDSISISPIEYLLTGLLATLSGAVGKKRFFKITRSIEIYLNVWAVIIGKSTIMKKTTAINIVKEDLQRLEIKSHKEYYNQLNVYKRKMESKNKEEKLNLVKPVRHYYLLPQDSTVESLAEIMAESERGLLTHSEFGSFLQQLNRGYSADAKQFLTTIFDVPETYEVSRVTKENTFLHKPYLSVLGASTIDWIQENSSTTDLRSGFFARFIYSIRNVPSKEYIPLLSLRKQTKQSDIYVLTSETYRNLSSFTEDKEIGITKAAEKIYTEFDIESHIALMESENENELSFKARLAIYTLKFAGLIALCDGRELVTANDMLDAIEISEYYKRNIEHLLRKEIVKDEFSRNEDKIIRFLSKRGGESNRTNLMNGTPFRAKELDELLDNLIQKEVIEAEERKGHDPQSNRSYTARIYKLIS